MERFYIFHICMAAYGATFAIRSVSAIIEGSTSLPITVAGIAGVGMIIASVHEVLTRSPSDFEIGNLAFWAVVLGVVGFLLFQIPELF
ncbi:hypothetical protein [Halostagnicola kamekurae]|uniref:Uncharacterized protein n=1 Tax=Halostagnicola kamekurae TaxID=619731 RepID=A0A1I6QA46_9EURY|nr:hypothetical protein [Halostagnicola kamekurae]SFS49225.1 hypothetical protein SAMN04488556_1106 [Halostagnicola kamekurae]